MSVEVNIYDAKTQLSKLIERALAGERVVICKAGKPVVDLVRHQGVPIQFGRLAHAIRYDAEEFDAADTEIRAMFDPEFELGDAPS